jgi:hypothetical protein
MTYICSQELSVEEWQLEFEWLRVQHYIKSVMSKSELPDLNGVLFLVGIQELGRIEEKFTKEEKQDLMHIAVCVLLSEDGYFEFQGKDADGWPHFSQIKPLNVLGPKDQERLLKERAIGYFAAETAQLAKEN